MKYLKHHLLFVFILQILIMGSPSNAQNTNGYGSYSGTISSDEFTQGSIVTFTGSVYNVVDADIFVYTFNITFLELLGQASTRDPKTHNISKIYAINGFQLRQNNVYTDHVESKIDFNPGKYNVSIAFAVSNGTAIDTTDWEYKYALSNYTIQILGTSQSIRIALAAGIFLISTTGILIVLFIYGKIKK